MSLQPFQLYSGSAIATGLGVSLGIVVLFGTGSATAEQMVPTLGRSLQLAQTTQTPSSSGDVIIQTDPQTPKPSPSTEPSKLSGIRFTCQATNGQYTVMYHPESQPGQLYAWANPTAMGGGWTPERRCNEISRRLESYRPDGLLEMQTGMENGYNTVCVTTEKVPGCRIVLTVPVGQDPVSTRDRVFQNLTVADSGQQTQAVNTLVENGQDGIVNQLGQMLNIHLPNSSSKPSRLSNGINLRPFLDRADGGTGEYLRQGSFSRSTPRRLDPNKFR